MKRKRVQKFFHKPSLTKQAFRDETDLNLIVRNFAQTGSLPGTGREVQYGVPPADFQEAHFALAAAKSTFESLRPEVRAKYEDVTNVLRAMDDPGRASELASDGILQAYGIQPIDNVEKHGSDDLEPEQAIPADTPAGGDEVPSEASQST